MIEFIKEKIHEQTERRKVTMEEIGKMITKAEAQKIQTEREKESLGKEILAAREQRDAAEAKAKEAEIRLKRLQESTQGKKDPNSIGLMDFLGIEPSEWFGKMRVSELEKALVTNLMRRLMH